MRSWIPAPFNESKYFDVVVEYAKASPHETMHPPYHSQPRARGFAAAMSFPSSGFLAIPGPGREVQQREPVIADVPNDSNWLEYSCRHETARPILFLC